MNKAPPALLSLVLLLAASSAQAAQPRVAVLPMSGVNIHPGYLEAARDIFKDHLMGTGKFYVISVPGHPPDHELTPEEAIARGKEVNADLVTVAHLVLLSGTARVRLTVFRTSDGSIAHTDGMTTRGGPDDLDPVFKRLAVGFATGQPASRTAEIDSVTQREYEPYLKQEATRVFGVRLGAVVPLSRPTGDVSAGTGVGLFWLYDAREFMAEIWGDFYVSSSSASHVSIFDLGLGAYYPFSRKNITPYAGGGAAWSITDLGGEGANGVRLNGAAGVLIGRLWSVQCRAELGYFVNLFGERSNPYTATGMPQPTKTAYSHGPMLTLGLGL
jgi:hypothetical protein